MNTKADNLRIKIKKGIIPKFKSFFVTDYIKNKDKIIRDIKKNFKIVAIRSSNYFEDNGKKSFAGKFVSVLNVNTNNTQLLEKNIKQVINSYTNYFHNKNQILIQEMVKNVKISGVITTHDKNDLSPYYVINISKSRFTDTITSGANNNNQTFYIFRSYSKKISNNLKKIILLAKELEGIKKNKFLDIEFAISKNKIYLLQVRSLTKKIKTNVNQSLIKNYLEKLERKIQKLQKENIGLPGKTTYFGIMPDWNPAEIIGRRPYPLSLSLYEELITNQIWAEQRSNYGYQGPKNIKLMFSFFGMPYIDMRTDFNSWLPQSLNKKISSKLVNHYLSLFRKFPKFHDKIEFKIIISCVTFLTKNKIKKLNKILTHEERLKFYKSLKNVTTKTFDNFEKDIIPLKQIDPDIKLIKNSKSYSLNKIYWLIEKCKINGTLPFAGLARSAFVANEILLSILESKIISKEEYHNVLSNIKTISSEMNYDLCRLKKNKFIKKYGHLRPNTYDIDTKNYKYNFNTYFNRKKNIVKNKKNKKIELINILKKYPLGMKPEKLEEFIFNSIQMREYSKFLFTKYIDEIFLNIEIIFQMLNLNKKDMKFLSIHTIKNTYNNLDKRSLRTIFTEEIKHAKKQYLTNRLIKLPKNIYKPQDIYFFSISNDEPNYITSKNIIGEVLYLDEINPNKQMGGKIICIENADPGYDFIFSHKIKGLITKFGGINSHMAIRCNELNIPAAIGTGEIVFDEIVNANSVQVNCSNHTIRKIA
jgi:glutamine kinase